MLKHVIQEGVPGVNALDDGFLSSVNDTALLSVVGLRNVSISLNLVANNIATLDLGAHLTDFNTVVSAKNSANPPSVVVAAGAGSKAGTISETGNTTTIHYDTTVSQVSDMEALLATSIYLNIFKHGTAANTLASPGDTLASTPLSTGDSTFSVLLEKSTDGVNWATIATVSQSSFPSGLGDNTSVEETLSVAGGGSDVAVQIRATLTALQGTCQLSLSAAGLQDELYR